MLRHQLFLDRKLVLACGDGLPQDGGHVKLGFDLIAAVDLGDEACLEEVGGLPQEQNVAHGEDAEENCDEGGHVEEHTAISPSLALLFIFGSLTLQCKAQPLFLPFGINALLDVQSRAS